MNLLCRRIIVLSCYLEHYVQDGFEGGVGLGVEGYVSSVTGLVRHNHSGMLNCSLEWNICFTIIFYNMLLKIRWGRSAGLDAVWGCWSLGMCFYHGF